MYIYQDEILMTKKLENLTYNWKGKSVLDLGCNAGKLWEISKSAGASRYLGVDISKDMIKVGKERYEDAEFVEGDVNVVIDRSPDYDVTVAMALFHHFTSRKLRGVIRRLKSKELIFEVPVGSNDVGLYQLRDEKWYRDLIVELYGKVQAVVKSGATNDPYNPRVIFVCKRND